MRCLLGLQADGVVESRGFRWRAMTEADRADGSEADGAGPYLTASPVAVEPDAGAGADPAGSEDDAIAASTPLLTRLLPHYAECLRAAGSSRLAQVPDRHGTQFLLLRPDRAWWPTDGQAVRLRVGAAHLPPTLLEALYARRGEPVMLGYPLAVFTHDGETYLRPVGVLACAWSVGPGGDLTLRPQGTSPVLNPDWIGAIRRNRTLARIMVWAGQGGRDPDDGLVAVGHGEWADFPQMVRSIGTFLASERRTPLRPERPDPALRIGLGDGLHNALGIFLAQGNRYSAGARRDLMDMSGWDAAAFGETALDSLFGLPGYERPAPPVLPPLPLGEDQLVATRDALAAPLTVITGPPGTGKTQVVVAIMASAALAGRSVLLASRTHQALDAVEQRLAELLPTRVLLARARALDHTREFDFLKALDAVLARGADAAVKGRLQSRVAELRPLERAVWETVAAADRLTAASDELGRLGLELARSADASSTAGAAPDDRGWWGRILRLLGLRRGRGGAPTLRSADAELRDRLDRAEQRHRECLAELRRLQEAQPLENGLDRLCRGAAQLLEPLSDALQALEPGERERLAALRGDLGLHAGAGADDPRVNRRLWSDGADLLLPHFPLWATTALSAANRIPLIPGLFDYVVIDEATTCDIASALPLLARARQAIIVGDKAQTAMVVDLDPRRELEMLARAGLNRPGIGRFAFTQSNIFDLAASSPSARHHLLRDHFRCHEEIADYISEVFYGRRLAVLTDERALRPPAGMRPGTHWTDVRGPLARAGTGCVSEAEARAIADHLHDLLEVQDYAGTVGVVTPFARQAEQIVRLCDDRISYARRDRARLRIATSHAFQGDARDVVLISLCYGPDMPHGAAWFLAQSRELVNVAVSRARAVCHVFGNREAVLGSGIPHLALLARRSVREAPRSSADDRFESPWEARLYGALTAHGLTPVPQYPLAGRRLDLALIKGDVRLDVEVDGDAFHRDPDGFRKVSDLWRDHQIRGLGWKVLRFWTYELRDDMEGCVERVIAALG